MNGLGWTNDIMKVEFQKDLSGGIQVRKGIDGHRKTSQTIEGAKGRSNEGHFQVGNSGDAESEWIQGMYER